MGVLCMRSKPYGDPSMGLRWPRSERYDAQGPPWLYPQKVQSRAVTLLGERPTGQKRTQRAASLILGQPPRRAAPHLKKRADAQSIQWWVLMRGFVDRNKKVSLLARAPIALPFWIWSYFKQELDIASSVRTAYDAFYNSLDIVTDARSMHN